jgi:hypothetical protein
VKQTKTLPGTRQRQAHVAVRYRIATTSGGGGQVDRNPGVDGCIDDRHLDRRVTG